jgi:peroxiredoxin Q/BCP
MKPRPGDPAPPFRALVVGPAYAEGDEVDSADLLGQRFVLVFYPKDATPGCTQQACDLRDGWQQLAGKAKVFGVSTDTPRSHRKFIDKYSLGYPLLADEGKEIVSAYDVWVEMTLYGRKYMGTERSTFVIGADGLVEAVLEKVTPSEHLEQLLAALA